MSDWRPLFARGEENAQFDGPFPGIPAHMRASLRSWVAPFLRYVAAMEMAYSYRGDTIRSIENSLRLELSSHDDEAFDELQLFAETGEERYLALLDYLLAFEAGLESAQSLETILHRGFGMGGLQVPQPTARALR